MADGGLLSMHHFTPGPGKSREFRDALGRFATGVTVVTCRARDGRPLGMTANSFASLSLDPPLVLWAPARASMRFAAFEAAEQFAIHVLGEHQHPLGLCFSREGFDFEGCEWTAGAAGVPLIEHCLARFECTRHAVHEGGDHAIIVGRVRRVATGDGAPLIFARGSYGGFAEKG